MALASILFLVVSETHTFLIRVVAFLLLRERRDHYSHVFLRRQHAVLRISCNGFCSLYFRKKNGLVNMLSGSRAATTLIVSTMVLAAIQMQTASSVAAAAKSNSSDMIDVEGSEAFTSKDLRLSEVESSQ